MARAARRLLDASTLCAIATTTPRRRPHVNTAYFAFTNEFDVVWLSEPSARHSINLRANAAAAVSVYDSSQRWGGSDRGIQLFGSAREASKRSAPDAEAAYARRFPAYEPGQLVAYRIYVFHPTSVKVFDERSFGAGVFVTARVDRSGRVTWERTDVYSSRDR
ncbi:MAG: pyridoxamine 5'-phosphate oxidase family protein [Actinomycetota bacterium]